MSRKEVIDKALGEIRSFLDELSNGTSRYRSLHNLGRATKIKLG